MARFFDQGTIGWILRDYMVAGFQEGSIDDVVGACGTVGYDYVLRCEPGEGLVVC